MTPALILHECRRRGIRISADGEGLRLRGDPESLTDDLVACIADHKAGLIGLILGQGCLELVHSGPALVHSGSRSGPLRESSGPDGRTDDPVVTPSRTSPDDVGPRIENEIGPLGPLPRRGEDFRAGDFPRTSGPPSGARAKSPESPGVYPRRSGPSGPGGPRGGPAANLLSRATLAGLVIGHEAGRLRCWRRGAAVVPAVIFDELGQREGEILALIRDDPAPAIDAGLTPAPLGPGEIRP